MNKNWEINNQTNHQQVRQNKFNLDLYKYPIYQYSFWDLKNQAALKNIALATPITFISATGHNFISALKRLIKNVNHLITNDRTINLDQNSFILTDFHIVVDQKINQDQSSVSYTFLSAHLISVPN